MNTKNIDQNVVKEIAEQINQVPKFEALINDPTSKYNVIPSMVTEWQSGKKIAELQLEDKPVEVIILLLRNLLKLDQVRMKTEWKEEHAFDLIKKLHLCEYLIQGS